MKIEKIIYFAVVSCALSAFAQSDARTAYQQRQAVQEVMRLSSQFDQLHSGMESLSARMDRLENSNSAGDVRAEISALRSELNSIKRRQDAMRGEIVAEISKKMADLIAKSRPAPQPAAPTTTSRGRSKQQSRNSDADSGAAGGPTGPYFEHTVEPGETLSYIAKECKTTIKKIKQYNNMKSDTLRVGQIIKIPAEGEN
jgi:LysM repeat protein